MFLDEYVSLVELSDENLTTLNQRLQPLIRLLESRYLIILDLLFGFHEKRDDDLKNKWVQFEQFFLFCFFLYIRHCAALDSVLGGHVAVGGTEQKRLFHQFLSLTMSSGKYQVHCD